MDEVGVRFPVGPQRQYNSMKTGKQIAILSAVTFVLHIAWENGQAPLFQGYESFVQHFPICLIGTIGDVIFTLGVFLVISLLKNNFHWIATVNKKDIIVLGVLGFLFAIGVEQHALLSGAWGYTGIMPIIPYLGVGLTPVAQMTLLLPLSIYLTKRFTARI